MVQVFLDHGLIKDAADIYDLTMEKLLTVPGIKEKSATNLLNAIERSKRRPLANVIFALGIRFVGFQTAEILAHAFRSIDGIVDANVETLESVEGIGRKTGKSIVEWMALQENRTILERLKAAGITWEEQAGSETATGALAGTTFLLTGRLDRLTRGQAEARLKDLGAKIAPGMSKGVDFLVAGADPGSKLAKAQKLGTEVRDEDWLVSVLEAGRLPE
jgi:DNA ligase (NAD+)